MSVTYDPPLNNARWVRRNGKHIGIVWETPYGVQFAKWSDLPYSHMYSTERALEISLEEDAERQEAIVKSLQQKVDDDD